MIKSEIERITHYYYGKSRNKQISFESFKEISEEDNIKNVFEIYEDGYVGCWYYVIRKQGSSVALDYGINNSTLKKLMEPCMNIHKRLQEEIELMNYYQII